MARGNVEPLAGKEPAAQVDTKDPETARFRQLQGVARVIQCLVFVTASVSGIAFVLGLHYTFGWMLYTEQYVGFLMALVLAGTFLSLPATSRAPRDRVPWYDVLLALASLPAGLFLAVKYPQFLFRLGHIGTDQVVMGALAIVLILEAVRRLTGWPLFTVVVLIILYGRFGSLLPGMFRGRPMDWPRLVNYIYTDPNSMLDLVRLGATIGLAFIVFGQVLLKFGAGQRLVDLSISLFGRYRGGPGKIAVLSSSLFGSVSGAPMSNVILTGTFTIPMMKRSGYKPETAAAIEAVASTGGQILPPVMGIAAFLIAENLGVPYATVALAALIPGLLFYVSFFLVVDLHARQMNIAGLPPEQCPPLGRTLRGALSTIVILIALIYFLFVVRLDLAHAGILASALALVLLLLSRENWERPLARILATLEESGRLLIDICISLAAAGIVVGVMNITGAGFVFSTAIRALGQNNPILLLFLTALTCIVLGMGMPTVPAYALVAVLMVPSLLAFGIPPLTAHLFVFYYAVLSNITPPIALACVAAAPIARANVMKVGLESVKRGLVVFLVPFMFVLRPAITLQASVAETVVWTVLGTISVAFWSMAIVGYLGRDRSMVERVIFGVAAAALMFAPTTPAGYGLMAVSAAVAGLLALQPLLGAGLHSSPRTQRSRV